MLQLSVPGSSSLGKIFPKIKWAFFSEWQKDIDFTIQQVFNSEDKETYHSTVLFLGSTAKLKGDKSGWSFATNADKEKQDVKKFILTENETSTCFLH